MKYFVDILKQFTQTQRLIVLVLLLSFTTGGVLLSQYLKTDDCRLLIDENLKMHEDFVKISSMLREERMRAQPIMIDTIMIGGEVKTEGVIQIDDTNTMDKILEIAESHN